MIKYILNVINIDYTKYLSLPKVSDLCKEWGTL